MEAKQRQALIGALQARGPMPMGKPMAAPMTALNPDQQRSLDAASNQYNMLSQNSYAKTPYEQALQQLRSQQGANANFTSDPRTPAEIAAASNKFLESQKDENGVVTMYATGGGIQYPNQKAPLQTPTTPSIGGFSPTGFTGPRPGGYDQPQTQPPMPPQMPQGMGQMSQGMPPQMPQGMPFQMPQGMQGGMQGMGQIPPNRPPSGMMMSRNTIPQFESKAMQPTMKPYGR